MACFRCPRCGRLHVLACADAEEESRCACGARFWVEGPADEGEPAGPAPPEGAQSVWAVEGDGTTSLVVVF